MITLDATPTKPDIEQLKGFKLLDLMSARHLNYLRDKSALVSYPKNKLVFETAATMEMGYFLLDGSVDIYQNDTPSLRISANSTQSYSSLDEGLAAGCKVVAATNCKIIKINISLLQAYFNWSATHEFAAIDSAAIHSALSANKQAWVNPLLESPLVKNLSSEQAKALVDSFETIRVQDGEVICHKGKLEHYFYVLSSGLAEMVDQNEQRKRLTVGCYFGGESLISSGPSDIFVVMNGQGTIERLNKKHFDFYIRRSLIRAINIKQLENLDADKYCLLDVRYLAEYKAGHVTHSVHRPVNTLGKNIDQLDKCVTYVIPSFCGSRGVLASYILQIHGFRSYILTRGKSIDSYEAAKAEAKKIIQNK